MARRTDQLKQFGGLGAIALAAGFGVQRLIRNRALNHRLRDKIVLITGGSRGLGLALAREFGRHGAKLALCARDQEEVERARELLGKEHISATPFVVDLSVHSNIPPFVSSVVERMGRVDVLINNAGLIRVGPYQSTSLSDYEDAMNLMFWAPVHLTRAIMPHMQERGSGAIVNISSIGGRVSIPHLLPYSCAKFALTAFSTGIGAEVKNSGIHVLTATPGLMRTGSHLNARFAGDANHELAWFGILGNMPGFSVGVEYAASEIRYALVRGKTDLTISLPAKLLARFEALMPNLNREVMAVMNQLLPSRESKDSHRGGTLEEASQPGFQALTALGRRAAAKNNEFA